MSWSLYIPRATPAEISKAKAPDDLSKAEAKQFTRAKRIAGAIAKSGDLAGPRFDVSVAGHHGKGRADSITVSVAQDVVGG